MLNEYKYRANTDITASLLLIMTPPVFFFLLQAADTHRCARRGAAGRGRQDGLLHLLPQPHGRRSRHCNAAGEERR